MLATPYDMRTGPFNGVARLRVCAGACPLAGFYRSSVDSHTTQKRLNIVHDSKPLSQAPIERRSPQPPPPAHPLQPLGVSFCWLPPCSYTLVGSVHSPIPWVRHLNNLHPDYARGRLIGCWPSKVFLLTMNSWYPTVNSCITIYTPNKN